MYPTVPGMLVNVMEFSSPASSLEMPKSETCAIMSWSSKILLGFKSQCRTASKCWWWRYSIAIATSSIMATLWRKLCCLPSFEYNQSSKLPWGMYSRISALKSRLEQVVIIFTKFRCRAIRSARHSVSKLLEASSCSMFSTFIATTDPSSNSPLKTFPKLPAPGKLSSVKFGLVWVE